MKPRVAVVGARGYVGRELTTLLERHPGLELARVTTEKDPGVVVDDAIDAWFLAVPNGASEAWVAAVDRVREGAAIVDLSADHRFDDAWAYGQPERRRESLRAARRIANPGCYATAAQLALAPLVELLAATPSVFGVSGYSGAGTTPSPKNDPAVLRDNLLPYALAGHVHEREVTRQLGRPVFLMPHVAPFFRGITCTVSAELAVATTRAALWARFEEAYGDEPLVTLSDTPPLVRDAASRHGTQIGGLTVSDDGRHAVVVATIDNLLGGAASQAIRSLNLALGLAENEGLDIT